MLPYFLRARALHASCHRERAARRIHGRIKEPGAPHQEAAFALIRQHGLPQGIEGLVEHFQERLVLEWLGAHNLSAQDHGLTHVDLWRRPQLRQRYGRHGRPVHGRRQGRGASQCGKHHDAKDTPPS